MLGPDSPICGKVNESGNAKIPTMIVEHPPPSIQVNRWVRYMTNNIEYASSFYLAHLLVYSLMNPAPVIQVRWSKAVKSNTLGRTRLYESELSNSSQIRNCCTDIQRPHRLSTKVQPYVSSVHRIWPIRTIQIRHFLQTEDIISMRATLFLKIRI